MPETGTGLFLQWVGRPERYLTIHRTVTGVRPEYLDGAAAGAVSTWTGRVFSTRLRQRLAIRTGMRGDILDLLI